MDSLIKHIESKTTKYNSNNKDLNVRVIKVSKEIDKILNEKTKNSDWEKTYRTDVN